MALEDINSGTSYSWYYETSGKSDRLVDGTANDFGSGKENTDYVMNKWNNEDWGSQDAKDMWGVVQEEINKKKANNDKGTWFIASKSEWAAFGENLGITTGNYSTYGLYSWYWTSSQNGVNFAYRANFRNGNINDDIVYFTNGVRLCATF